MKRSRTMLVYGNRQAEAIAAVLGTSPQIHELMEVRYRAGDVNGCTVFTERNQVCFALTFPAMDFHLLWPFYRANPYNAPEADVPFGPFPYGDRVIVDAVDKNIAPGEILDYYIGGWRKYGVDLDRFRDLEAARMAEQNALCGVKMDAYILQHFAGRRLFWTVDRPAAVVLEELVERVLSACGQIEPRLKDADVMPGLETYFALQRPLGQASIPIHPRVSEYFALEWYDPNEKFIAWDGTAYSYTEYFSAMIRHAYAVKESRL